MRTILFVLPGLAVMALAFWAYSENYETQKSLDRVRALQREIGAQRETLSILRAEWAYLNRPDRLRDLVALNYQRLNLLPLAAHHFATVGDIAYPPDPMSSLADVTELEGELPQ